jgi:hypothetical protein
MEFTYGELKQGLICCTVYRNCSGCPLFDEDIMQTATVGDDSCTLQLMSAAFNCINIMEKDLADANKRAEMWEEAVTKHEQDLIVLRESLDRVKHIDSIEKPSSVPISTTDYILAVQNLKRCGVLDYDGKLNPAYECILEKRKIK